MSQSSNTHIAMIGFRGVFTEGMMLSQICENTTDRKAMMFYESIEKPLLNSTNSISIIILLIQEIWLEFIRNDQIEGLLNIFFKNVSLVKE